MTPVKFKQSNCRFGPPPDLEESQVHTIDVFKGQAAGGSCDGSNLIITAWKPDARELERINAGEPVFLTFMGSGLAPHMLTTSFEEASAPA